MQFSKQAVQLKNRIHANLTKYGIQVPEVSDLFGKRGHLIFEEKLQELPEQI